MDFRIEFWNPEQEIFCFSKARNNRFGGGFGNGKTYAACIKALIFLMCFPGYRVAFCRQVYKNLRSTTMQTFFKVCPKEFIKTHDVQFGLTVFINGSCVYWLHLDTMDEATAKGFEINALVIDQGEEVDEAIFELMDARVGRWDKAEVPQHLLDAYPQWPRHPKGNYPLVPNYSDVLDNPSDDEFHWISRYYDADSLEKREGYFSIVRQTDDNMNDPRTIAELKRNRGEEWLKKYYYGLKTTSGAKLHRIDPASRIEPDKHFQTDADFLTFINLLRRKGTHYRILDHGETDPTCVLWACSLLLREQNISYNIHVLYGEYYMPNEVISVHRQNIYDLTLELLTIPGEKEEYTESRVRSCIDLADPSVIEGTRGEKKGKHWTVAEEYLDEEEITAPPIAWSKADNNELATRNRINELLKLNERIYHPITKVSPAPTLYYVVASKRWPNGIDNVLIQTSQARKKLLGELNGQKFYSQERDPKIPDHGYDCERYYVAAHSKGSKDLIGPPPKRSFAHYNRIFKKLKRTKELY